MGIPSARYFVDKSTLQRKDAVIQASGRPWKSHKSRGFVLLDF